MQQNNLQQSTAPYKPKISKSFSNYIQRSPLHLDSFNIHSDKGGGNGQLYIIMRKKPSQEIDHEVQPKDWLHPAESFRITEQQDEHAIQIFTDGSKSENGVGAGIAIFIQRKLAHQLRERGRSWNSNIYPEETSTSIKVHTSQ